MHTRPSGLLLLSFSNATDVGMATAHLASTRINNNRVTHTHTHPTHSQIQRYAPVLITIIILHIVFLRKSDLFFYYCYYIVWYYTKCTSWCWASVCPYMPLINPIDVSIIMIHVDSMPITHDESSVWNSFVQFYCWKIARFFPTRILSDGIFLPLLKSSWPAFKIFLQVWYLISTKVSANELFNLLDRYINTFYMTCIRIRRYL